MVTRQDTIIKILKDIHETSQISASSDDKSDNKPVNKSSQKSSKQKNTETLKNISTDEAYDILQDYINNVNNIIQTSYANYYLVKHDDFQFTIAYINENKKPSIISDEELKKMPQLYQWYQDYFD